MKKKLYLCNGEKPECCSSCGCFKNGGDCNFTIDPTYYINKRNKLIREANTPRQRDSAFHTTTDN